MSKQARSTSNSILPFHLSPLKTSLLLFLLALIIRLAVIFIWQFDGLYGQDAYAYFDQAIAITQNLPQGQPPPVDFFWPNGYPLLIAFFMLLVGQTAWAGQLAALLCGAALAPLAFLLSQDLFSDPIETNNSLVTRSNYAGLLTGLIIAVAGQPILSSVVIMADMPALFWATLATCLVVRAVITTHQIAPFDTLRATQGATRRILSRPKTVSKGAVSRYGEKFSPALLRLHSPALWFLAAGVALALAVISRWLYVLIAPALGLYILFNLGQRYRKANLALDRPDSSKASFGLHKAGPNKNLWWLPLLAVLSGTIILVPQLWLSFNKPEGLAHSWLLGWSPANFFRREFENIDGHFIYQLPNFIFYAQPAGHPAYIFPLLGLASLWGLWRLGQTRQWGLLILFLGWAAPVYFFLAGIPYQNFRFGLTLYLPLVILTGFGLSDFLGREVGMQVCSPAVCKIIIALSLAGMLLWAYPMLNNFLTVQNQSKVIAHQVEQALPPQATLITFGLTLTFEHYTPLKTEELFYLDENSLKPLTESSDSLYLLLDLNSLNSQWQGKTPQINYIWLKEHATLTQIGTFPPYTLFKVAR